MNEKTEVFYMMRDKVIPALLNSEKTIKFDDIKEVLDKTSFWKKDRINNSIKLSKNCSPKKSNKKSNSNNKKKTIFLFLYINLKIIMIAKISQIL